MRETEQYENVHKNSVGHHETRAMDADARVDTMDGANPIDDRGACVDEREPSHLDR